jgi:hypothetical protein
MTVLVVSRRGSPIHRLARLAPDQKTMAEIGHTRMARCGVHDAVGCLMPADIHYGRDEPCVAAA